MGFARCTASFMVSSDSSDINCTVLSSNPRAKTLAIPDLKAIHSYARYVKKKPKKKDNDPAPRMQTFFIFSPSWILSGSIWVPEKVMPPGQSHAITKAQDGNLNSCGKFENFTIVHPCSPYIWASRRQTLPHLHTICLHNKSCKSNESNGAELNHWHATQPSRACASPQMRQVQLLVSVTTNQRPQLVGRAFKHATDVHPAFPLHATWHTSHFDSPNMDSCVERVWKIQSSARRLIKQRRHGRKLYQTNRDVHTDVELQLHVNRNPPAKDNQKMNQDKLPWQWRLEICQFFQNNTKKMNHKFVTNQQWRQGSLHHPRTSQPVSLEDGRMGGSGQFWGGPRSPVVPSGLRPRPEDVLAIRLSIRTEITPCPPAGNADPWHHWNPLLGTEWNRKVLKEKAWEAWRCTCSRQIRFPMEMQETTNILISLQPRS